MEILKGAHLIKCPFGEIWSGIVAIKRKRPVLIDTGPDGAVDNLLIPYLIDDMGLLLKDISMVINTHSHGDHISGNYRIKELANIPFAAHRLAVPKIGNPSETRRIIRARFSRYVDSPTGEDIKGIEVDISLDDGSIIDLEDSQLKIIHTPGHDTDSICIYEPSTGTLFTGDSVQGNGTKIQGIAFYQDVTAYRKSVEKIKSLSVETLISAHAYYPSDGVIKGKDKVRKFLENSLEYTFCYENKILELLKRKPMTVLEITKKVIENIGISKPVFLFLPLYTMETHLGELYKKSRVKKQEKDGRIFWRAGE